MPVSLAVLVKKIEAKLREETDPQKYADLAMKLANATATAKDCDDEDDDDSDE